jgi:hypothetical protein
MPQDKSVTAFPLCWPEGWRTTASHRRTRGYQFRQGHDRTLVTLDRARRLLSEELSQLGATQIVLSSNLPVRKDGNPFADAHRYGMDEPGVAAYFVYKGKPMVMAQDAFDNPAANFRSLGLAIEALRSLERHGGGSMMERAFAGFSALPPPEGVKPRRPWWEVMRYPADPAERELLSMAEIKARYNTLAKRLHPDAGGNAEDMAELNLALEDAERELQPAAAEPAAGSAA